MIIRDDIRFFDYSLDYGNINDLIIILSQGDEKLPHWLMLDVPLPGYQMMYPPVN
jgi:hypothetical protein